MRNRKRESQETEDWKLAWRYLPRFYGDEAEPFAIQGAGYTVFREDGNSASCSRSFQLDKNKCKCMIEYAVFYDFDIQHLYDLEHVFVYIGYDGEVVDVEASFHGKFLRSMVNGVLRLEDSHPVIYMQPGKHAMMPAPDYFQLYIELYSACREKAGNDGFLVAPMFKKRLSTTPELDEKVRSYIRRHYSFTPTDKYRYFPLAEGRLLPYLELEEQIVERMQYWIEMIQKEGKGI